MQDIPGYEQLYAVTKNGDIWSYKSQSFLVPVKNRKGYLYVFLYKDGIRRKFYVHRLVMITFAPDVNMENLTVNHKDEDKTNNCLNNLEWMTIKENNNYGTRIERAARSNSVSILNNPKISQQIQCVETGVIYLSIREAERQTGIDHSCICKAVNGRRETAGGYHWRSIADT